MIVLLGSVGLPLTNGFIGEFILLKSIFDYNVLAAIIAGITIILAAAYLFRAYGHSMFTQGNDDVLASAKDLTDAEFSVMASIALMVILFGVFPQPVIELVSSSLKFIYCLPKRIDLLALHLQIFVKVVGYFQLRDFQECVLEIGLLCVDIQKNGFQFGLH